MPPVRVKVYGLVSLTRQTYLRIQAVGLILLLSMMAAGGAMMRVSGVWRPTFPPPPNVEAWLILFFWVSLATLLLEVLETTLVLRKFAQVEARQQNEEALASARLAIPSVVPNAGAVQLPPGVQPTRSLENHPNP